MWKRVQCTFKQNIDVMVQQPSPGSPVCFCTKRANFPKRANRGVMLSLYDMAFHPCVSGCCSYLAPDNSHDRWLLSWMSHAATETGWLSQCCGRDFNTSGEVKPPYLCLNLFQRRGLFQWIVRLTWRLQWGQTHWVNLCGPPSWRGLELIGGWAGVWE